MLKITEYNLFGIFFCTKKAFRNKVLKNSRKLLKYHALSAIIIGI